MLGQHRRGDRAAGWWRHPGWSWAAGRDWLVPAGVATATLLLGAALAGLPVVVAGNLRDPQVRAQSLAFALLGAAGLVTLAATAIVRRGRDALLARNGTAYVVREMARGWAHDDVTGFFAAARRQFARTIVVPGPGALAGSWDWPLEDGAEQWDTKLADLTLAVLALHSDDDRATPNGFFIWGWWPVALALCARLAAADRGFTVSVWQRPTRGRAGHLTPAPWSQRPHLFGMDSRAAALCDVLPGAKQAKLVWPARLTVIPLHAHRRARAAGASAARFDVLLIRLGGQRWGPLPGGSAPDGAAPADLVVHDAAGLGRHTAIAAEVHEFRVVPPDGAAQFPWEAFPHLVAEAAAWVRSTAAGLTGSTLLLGTTMPAETAAGLGIDAAALTGEGWPQHLWPMVYDPGRDAFVVPRLDLGAERLAG